MFVQKNTSKSVNAAIEYTNVMKTLDDRKSSMCTDGIYWSENVFDSNGDSLNGFVSGSCGKLMNISRCVMCGIHGKHRKCSAHLRVAFCDSCGSKISSKETEKVTLSITKQIIEFPTDIIANKRIKRCYSDFDYSCEGDGLDDCIGDDRDQINFTGEQIVEMLNN